MANGYAVYHNLGYQWATSLLAFLTLVMVPFPYVLVLTHLISSHAIPISSPCIMKPQQVASRMEV